MQPEMEKKNHQYQPNKSMMSTEKVHVRWMDGTDRQINSFVQNQYDHIYL